MPAVTGLCYPLPRVTKLRDGTDNGGRPGTGHNGITRLAVLFVCLFSADFHAGWMSACQTSVL